MIRAPILRFGGARTRSPASRPSHRNEGTPSPYPVTPSDNLTRTTRCSLTDRSNEACRTTFLRGTATLKCLRVEMLMLGLHSKKR